MPIGFTLPGHPVHLLLTQLRHLLRLRGRIFIGNTVIPPVGALAPAPALGPVKHSLLGIVDIHGVAVGSL
jgi:hypothetical protein